MIGKRASFARVLAVASGALVLLAGCSEGREGVAVDFASVDSVTSVATSTEYMVRGTILGKPTASQLDAPSVTHYAVVQLKVTSVLATRPDVKHRIIVGEELVVGFNVLDPAQRGSISNYDALAQQGFPTQDQVPAKGADVIAFLVAEPLGSIGTGYESVGYADAGKDPATFHALPGSLNGKSIPLASIIGPAVLALYARPAPWRAASTPQ